MRLADKNSNLSNSAKADYSNRVDSGDSTKSISSAMRRFFSGTLLSRVSGLGRDVSMAAIYGSDPAIAAFLVAFRFAHLLRRLLGEGALHAAFVPQFEALRQKDSEAANAFFRDVTLALSLLLSVIVTVGLTALALSSGWWEEGNQQIVDLLKLMLPSLLFICLFGLNSALLQCNQRYFLPAAAPIAFNIIWIAGAWWHWQKPPSVAVHSLSWVIVAACFAQWMVTLPYVTPLLVKAARWRPNVRSGELLILIRSLGFGLIGVGAMQLNSALDTLFARTADLSGPAYLWWAIRLQQVPVGLFGVAAAGALLPPLSRAVKQGDQERAAHFLTYALERAALVILPATGALLVGGVVSVNLVYGHGNFDARSVAETTKALWGYSLGMFPTVCVMLLAPAYYATNNYRSPALAGCIAVAVNIFLNALLVFGMGYGPAAVAVATSLSALVNLLFLGRKLDAYLTRTCWKEFGCHAGAVLLTTLLAMGVTFIVGRWIGDPTLSIATGEIDLAFDRGLSSQLSRYLIMAVSYAGTLTLGVLLCWRKGYVRLN